MNTNGNFRPRITILKIAAFLVWFGLMPDENSADRQSSNTFPLMRR